MRTLKVAQLRSDDHWTDVKKTSLKGAVLEQTASGRCDAYFFARLRKDLHHRFAREHF